MNRVGNVHLLKSNDSPVMPIDYQYQETDPNNFNFVASMTDDGETTHTRNHRKRHLQHKQIIENINSDNSDTIKITNSNEKSEFDVYKENVSSTYPIQQQQPRKHQKPHRSRRSKSYHHNMNSRKRSEVRISN